MRKEDIPTGCATNPDDRTKILVAIEPRAYRSAVGRAIQILRPHLEVSILEPDELGTEEVARLDPALVISSRPKPATSDGGPAWMEFRPYDEAPAKVCIGGRCARFYEPGLDDLLSVVDEFEDARGERTGPESRRRLDEQVTRIEEAGGTVAEAYLRVGKPDDQIVRLAQEIGAGLIVMGSRGHGGVLRALMGSVSESVIRHAHCPVLVVRA